MLYPGNFIRYLRAVMESDAMRQVELHRVDH